MMDMMNMGGSGGSMGGMSGGSMGMGSMGGADPMSQMAPVNYVYVPYYPNQMADHTAHASNGVLGFDLVSLFTTLFNLAINIFALVLVVALILGSIVFIKKYLFDGNIQLNGLLSSNVNGSCVKCGQRLQAHWNCCPKCGESKVNFVVNPAQSQEA